MSDQPADGAVEAVRAFRPTGDETEDVGALYDLVDDLGPAALRPEALDELIAVFERYSNHEFGSPGPIVHALEDAPLPEHVARVCASLRRRPTAATVWMGERCEGADLRDEDRAALDEALRAARARNESSEP